MGLSTVLKAAAVTAFSAVSDLLVSATFTQAGATSYSPASGNTEEAELTTASISILIETYTDREIDGERVLSTDRKVSVPATSLGSTITPKVGDKLTFGTATDALSTDNEWRIEEVTTDPAEALWVFRVRQ